MFLSELRLVMVYKGVKGFKYLKAASALIRALVNCDQKQIHLTFFTDADCIPDEHDLVLFGLCLLCFHLI